MDTEHTPSSNLFDLFNIRKADKYDAEHLDEILQELADTKELCKQLDTIIEYSPDGVYITDGDATAVRINPAFEKISGLDRSKMLGVNHRKLVKDHIVARSSALMVVEQKREVTIIHEYIPSNRKALVTSRPVFAKDGSIHMIVSSIRDLTQLLDLRTKLEQEARRASEYKNQLEAIQSQLAKSDDMIVRDKKMYETLHQAERVMQVDSTVLLTGETGVGKEEMAKFIHRGSPRKDFPFVAVNCGAIPAPLVESELFGYEGGAFTGALREGKKGRFEQADRGTIFLDEVGELPLDTQVKLLRVLQERKIQRLGSARSIPVDVRIISATHRDLFAMAGRGEFREDLYYRLCVVPITIPPLRERKDDIIPLIQHFLDDSNQKYGTRKRLSGMAYRVLYYHDWPGNVRELKSLIERIVVMTEEDVITSADIPLKKNAVVESVPVPENTELDEGLPLEERLARLEYSFIKAASAKYHTVRKAAESLGMPASSFCRRKKLLSEKFDREK